MPKIKEEMEMSEKEKTFKMLQIRFEGLHLDLAKLSGIVSAGTIPTVEGYQRWHDQLFVDFQQKAAMLVYDIREAVMNFNRKQGDQ